MKMWKYENVENVEMKATLTHFHISTFSYFHIIP